MPGAPMQRWYCSVFLRWKRDARPRRAHERRAQPRPPRRRFPLLALGFLELSHERVVLQVPGRGDDDVAGPVHRLVVARQRTAADRRDHLGRADHRPAERVVAEDRLAHQVVDELVGRVLVHRDLLEHDLALRVEVGEHRRVDHVRHHVERLVDVMVGDPDVDDGVLARGRRVQLAAEPVEDLGDVLRGVGTRPLEEQVLDEVRDPGLGRGLVAGPGSDPETEGNRPDARDALGDDPLARVELAEDVLLHRQIVVAALCPARCGGMLRDRGTALQRLQTIKGGHHDTCFSDAPCSLSFSALRSRRPSSSGVPPTRPPARSTRASSPRTARSTSSGATVAGNECQPGDIPISWNTAGVNGQDGVSVTSEQLAPGDDRGLSERRQQVHGRERRHVRLQRSRTAWMASDGQDVTGDGVDGGMAWTVRTARTSLGTFTSPNGQFKLIVSDTTGATASRAGPATSAAMH